jgi:hypothetical protein
MDADLTSYVVVGLLYQVLNQLISSAHGLIAHVGQAHKR